MIGARTFRHGSAQHRVPLRRREGSSIPCMCDEPVRAQHGGIKGQQTAIVAMGRRGSREMTASSDLDPDLLYDFDGEHPEFGGERSLHGADYFARLPSGRSAPLQRGPTTECGTNGYAAAFFGPRRAGCFPDRFLCRNRNASMDLGTHGVTRAAGDLGADRNFALKSENIREVLTRPRGRGERRHRMSPTCAAPSRWKGRGRTSGI